jgi:hypothetical protein
MPNETHSREELESPEVGNREVVLNAAGMLLLMLASVGVLAAVYIWQVPNRTVPPPEHFPPPQVRVDESALRARLEAEQKNRLAGYRRENGREVAAGMPIERAMEILAHRGASAYDPIIAPSQAESAPGPAAAAAHQTPRPSIGQGPSLGSQVPERSGPPAGSSGSNASPVGGQPASSANGGGVGVPQQANPAGAQP